jgi:hypothetical protein
VVTDLAGIIQPGHVATTLHKLQLPPGSSSTTRRQVSTLPTGSAVPYTHSVGCPIPASSASRNISPGR